jgi:alpha-1,3-rhamnosyltransferase
MTTTYPLVSIIIPVYNRADYIEEALNSVFQEEYPNLEVVVIDDGSTDNTKDIIEHWMSKQKGSLLTQFISRENKGVVATLNDLIEASKGQYIVFFGSDDCLLNNGIIKRYEYLQKHPEK